MKTTILASLAAVIYSIGPIAWAQDLPQAVTKHREMVVTSNPLASAAGANILRQGGTAADAMVAVQAVLGLVEPQNNGMGGGAFVVYYEANTRTLTTIDARETAPAAARENRFSRFTSFFPAWQSGLSVGVPGTPRMMEYVHQKFGRLKWKKLFKSAIKLATKGYPLTQRTSDQVAFVLSLNTSCDERLFFRDPKAFEYFANPNCTAKSAGTLIINPDYAATMKTLAGHGADGFYSGKIAENIVAAVQGDPAIGGDMTVQDLANYEVIERPPVCFDYRGHNICGMGPPSSGAIAVGQILGILETFDLSVGEPLDENTVHLFSQAGRLAFADRGLYVGDPDFVTVPVEGLLDKAYLASRAKLIKIMDMGVASPGVPPGAFDPRAPDNRTKNTGTSHVSIVDRYGNALSMTTTIENFFGNGVMVNGFLLNNELTDFSFRPIDPATGLPMANRVQGNKRPRSSMAPTIIFDKRGRVEIVTGSPGGSGIISYTAQSIVNMIDFGLDPQEAINIPHFMNRNGGTTDIEAPIPGATLDYDVQALADALEARGHKPSIIEQNSGLSIIQIFRNRSRPRWWGFKGKDGDAGKGFQRNTLIGGADHRRDGTVSGR